MHRPDLAEQFLDELLLRVGVDLVDELNQEFYQPIYDFFPPVPTIQRHERVPDIGRMPA